MSQYAMYFEIVLPSLYQRDFHLKRNVINEFRGKKLAPITILVTLLFHNFKHNFLSHTFSIVVLPLNYLITAIPHGALDSPHSLWVFSDLMWLLVV